MDELLKEIKADIKEMKSDIKEISNIMSQNTASLIVHEARTTLAEKRIERFENGSKWLMGLIASGVITTAIKLLTK
jgi:superfamily II DNA or RNA helicase